MPCQIESLAHATSQQVNDSCWLVACLYELLYVIHTTYLSICLDVLDWRI